jgi:hypothetical protein
MRRAISVEIAVGLQMMGHQTYRSSNPGAVANGVRAMDSHCLIWGFIFECVVRIPGQAGQRFQPKLDSNSKASWTLIPVQAGQPKVIT